MPIDSDIPQWEMYDITNNPEHDLYENLVVERNDIFGVEVLYYSIDYDGENIDDFRGTHLKEAYPSPPATTKVTYDTTDENKIVEAFGMTADDVIKWLYIPIYTFQRDVVSGGEPHIGDVIKARWNDNSYEIVDVSREDNIFQLSKLVYEMKCRPFRIQDQKESNEIIIDSDEDDKDKVVNYKKNYGDFYN
jgi:hypothetical protein